MLFQCLTFSWFKCLRSWKWKTWHYGRTGYCPKSAKLHFQKLFKCRCVPVFKRSLKLFPTNWESSIQANLIKIGYSFFLSKKNGSHAFKFFIVFFYIQQLKIVFVTSRHFNVLYLFKWEQSLVLLHFHQFCNKLYIIFKKSVTFQTSCRNVAIFVSKIEIFILRNF